MLYRRFGKTEEQVSVLGFGCMRLPVIGGDPTKIDEEKATAMLRHAIDQGVNYVDTAYPYHGTGMEHPGQSEPFVGRALRDGYRQKVKLATKLPSWLVKTRADMDRFLDEQLARLETDYIDFYLVHSLNVQSWENLKQLGISEFLDQALKDGKIKHAGFSFHDKVELFKEIVDYYDWSFCQIQYNYLDEEFQAGREGLDYAAERGLGIVIMEPLRGGKLAQNMPKPAQVAFDQAVVQRTPAEWALRWVWNHPEVGLLLSGMTTMDHVTENLKVADEAVANSLTEQEVGIIDQVKRVFKERIKVDCTACGYCMPCPMGVNIPSNFARYNDYHVFGSPDTLASHKKMYLNFIKPEFRASQCAECGKCEEHCPQAIGIIEQLKGVKELFEGVD